MFYSPAILAKKGELSQIWLAAHWANKLSKQQALSVNIAESCDAIKTPSVPLSLRLSGQLLHGVARIHQKKLGYLSEDCSDALLKIKMAFRPGVVNISMQETSATPSKINAPAIGPMDEDLPSPSPRNVGKNRFQGVEIKLDDDDWMKMTPVHTSKRSITRPSRVFDDSDARSTTTMDDKDENWSEFPFVPGSVDGSSIELVRRADQTRSEIGSVTNSMNQAHEQPYQYEEAPVFDDGDFHPSADGVGVSGLDLKGGSEIDDGLMLQTSLNRSWVQDVEMQEDEENKDEENVKSTKKTGTPATVSKKKREVPASRRKKRHETVTELTNEQIQDILGDCSDIVEERTTLSAKIEKENELRSKGFSIQHASVRFDSGMETPSTSGLHPRLLQMFKQNAKPVSSFSGEKEEDLDDEEDVEVVRAAQGMLDEDQQNLPQNDSYESYQYEDGGVLGDDFRPSNADQMDGSNVIPSDSMGADELEVTLRDDDNSGLGGESFISNADGRKSLGKGDGEKWSQQTIRMMRLLREKISESDSNEITYQELAEGQRKPIVAKAFFEVLHLATRGMIQVAQAKPYSVIQIVPGRKYETLLPGEEA